MNNPKNDFPFIMSAPLSLVTVHTLCLYMQYVSYHNLDFRGIYCLITRNCCADRKENLINDTSSYCIRYDDVAHFI